MYVFFRFFIRFCFCCKTVPTFMPATKIRKLHCTSQCSTEASAKSKSCWRKGLTQMPEINRANPPATWPKRKAAWKPWNYSTRLPARHSSSDLFFSFLFWGLRQTRFGAKCSSLRKNYDQKLSRRGTGWSLMCCNN